MSQLSQLYHINFIRLLQHLDYNVIVTKLDSFTCFTLTQNPPATPLWVFSGKNLLLYKQQIRM